MSFHKIIKLTFLLFALFIFFTTACKKDKLLTQGGTFRISTDTLKFDTVFTTFGSVTRTIKLYNNNNKRVKFERIFIEGGKNSIYRLNVDGENTKDISNIELAANDSMYIFVAVTVNPNADNAPFVIEDKLHIILNGEKGSVVLQAYGQNAHYIRDSVLTTQTWINDKPYVILGDGALIDKEEVLTIQKGCRIYMHATAKLYIAGTLKTLGTKKDSIIFQGDRLDRDYFNYKDYPGEWRGIHFLSTSKQSLLSYTIFKNGGLTDATIWIQNPEVPLGGPMVKMQYCKIFNSAGYGIICFNSGLELDNCLIHTCGLQNLALVEGGEYDINACTFATYGGIGINHAQQPTVAILNYRDTSLTQYVGANLKANFRNTIIWGPLDNEVFLNKKGAWNYDVNFQNCLLKNNANAQLAQISNSIINADPQFADYPKWDFRPLPSSPAVGAGMQLNWILTDLDEIVRPPAPTIGCYEPK